MARMKNSDFCYAHNPDTADERKLGSKRGQERRYATNNHGSSARIETLKDVKKRYAEIFNELRLADGDREIKRNADKMMTALKGFTETYEKEQALEKLGQIADYSASLSELAREKHLN